MPRGLLVPASYLLLLRDGADGPEVLLLLRAGTGYRDGHWGALAGHVEEGETAAAAAVREAHEECGVVVEEPDLRPLTTLHRITPGAGQVEQRVDFFWTTQRWSGEPDKAAGMRWFPLRALPDPVVPHERRVLDLLAAGAEMPAVLLG